MPTFVDMNHGVRPKKYLGQHFLADKNIAEKIAGGLSNQVPFILEIGPGTGSLTECLLPIWQDRLWVIDIDKESIEYLNKAFPQLKERIVEGDILRFDLNQLFKGEQFSIIGNFPYNISSQILFKVLEYNKQVVEVVGMFQKEVARRICSPPGNKDYGILSVLLQAYYETVYLFDVPPSVFIPPPAVNSGVIKLTRKVNAELGCNPELFTKVVKTAFNQRRKKLSNALSPLMAGKKINSKYMDLRAEQLSWKDFAELTRMLENN